MLGAYVPRPIKCMPDAKETLLRLRADPTRRVLATNVAATLRMIRDKPGSAEARRRSYRTTPQAFWGVPVRGSGEEWVVYWRPDPSDGIPTILLICPEAASR